MAKPTQKKRPELSSIPAESRVAIAEVMLRGAARNFSEVAELESSDPRWRREWFPLRRAAIRLVAAIIEENQRALRRQGRRR